MNQKLYKFHWDYGNMGDVHGIFIATDEEIKDALGRVVSFGSALGKYSDIYGDLEEKDLEVVSEDQNFIQQFSECIGRSFGYNPLEYILE